MRSLTPAGIHPPFAAYAHGVEAFARRLVVTSGQLGISADGVIPETAEGQADLCFANIDAILGEAGLGRAQILRINAYVTDRSHMAGYMAARDRYLMVLTERPASTLMIVSGFNRPEFLVEIEALAAEEDAASPHHHPSTSSG